MTEPPFPFPPRVAEEIARRNALRAQYTELFAQLEAILFRHDPIGINFKDNTDEYAPEVGTILPRLKECGSDADVARIVNEEFVRWFGEDAGSVERYRAAATEMWAAWMSHEGRARA